MKNILIVDDDASCLYLLERILESGGFKVTKAANGVEAFNILKRLKFDVMITDFNMPGMNSIQLAKKVKVLHAEMVIIMVTAGWLPDVVEAAANAGISQILSKPYNVKQLLANIKLVEGVVHTSDSNRHIEEISYGRVNYVAAR